MYTVKQADEYIAANAQNIDKTYYPRYHMAPPIGWMNDPNGLAYFNGEYRLFYQYHPYSDSFGAMHWGQFVSSDLIEYRHGSVALCPSGADETSCFSGGGIAADGKLYLMYTRHYETENVKKEWICLAESADGKTFEKRAAAVFDNAALPSCISRSDFRDPFPVRVGEKYYVFVGGKDERANRGVIVVLSGRSLDRLEYDFCIGPFYELGEMAECPCYAQVDGKDVIVVSGCGVKEKDGRYKNGNISVFAVGDIDFENKRMNIDFVKEMDCGDCFYAPQFVNDEPRPTVIGWLEMWNKRYPTRERNHGWVGAFSLPRELSIVNCDIIQSPIAAAERYFSPCNADGELPQCSVIEAELPVGASIVIAGETGQIVVGNDGEVFLDTTKSNNLNGCVRKAKVGSDSPRVRVFLDVSCVEVFADDGRQTISSRFYIDGRMTLTANGARGLTVKAFEPAAQKS